MVKLRVNGRERGRQAARRSGKFAISIRRLPIGDRFALREKRGGFPRPASRAR